MINKKNIVTQKSDWRNEVKKNRQFMHGMEKSLNEGHRLTPSLHNAEKRNETECSDDEEEENKQ